MVFEKRKSFMQKKGGTKRSLFRPRLRLLHAMLDVVLIVCDKCVLSTQLGTPRGRYEEHNSKFLSVVKLRFIEPVGESQTSKGDAC
jgi:hypothetical protein